MAYIALDVEVSGWPHVERFVRQMIEGLFFRDVHAMLRLPLRNNGVTVGCNFAAAHLLLAAVAGLSASLYRPGSLKGYGSAFIGVLVDFYPWEDENAAPKTRA